MKKTIPIFLIVLCCILFSACSVDTPKTPENTTNQALTEAEESTENSSQVSGIMENYTSEYKEPDFPVYYQFSDCEKSIELPSFDKTEARDGKEVYMSGGKTVYEKTYDTNGRIASIVVYDADGVTVSREYAFAYDSELSFSADYYTNGEMTERYKYNYDSEERITSVYKMGSTEESVLGGVECYEFNADGSGKSYVNSDNISDMVMNVIVGALSGGLTDE